MIVILKEEFKVHNGKGDTLVNLPKGAQLSTIQREYIRDGTSILTRFWDTILIEDMKTVAGYVFVRQNGRYIAIPKEMVDVPVSTGGGWFVNY
jgi:hypothetical protein